MQLEGMTELKIWRHQSQRGTCLQGRRTCLRP
jgi:hypothetical protein